jgi:uncharacterized membrane protein YGL010W
MAGKKSNTASTTSSAQHKMTPGLLAAHIFGISGLAVVVQAALGFQDASAALAFYGVYHREPWNQFIHFFGVPGILWSMILFLVHLKVPVLGDRVPTAMNNYFPLTYGLLLTLFYLVFYLQIDPFGGTMYAPVLYAMYSSAVYLWKQDQKKSGGTSWSGTGRLLSFAFVVHVFSWYIQIHLGHKLIEGAQPAVLQSLGGALTVAPLFSFYEGLWMMGINKALQNSTQTLVDKYTYELCTSGEVSLPACDSLSML